jgi:uncharacterized membrane protein
LLLISITTFRNITSNYFIIMRFSLLKAIRNTHKHPVNKILHAIGLVLYIIAILINVGFFINIKTNSNYSLILFGVAIALFLSGHKIEGNIRAITGIILFKYLKRSLKNRKEITFHKKH